MAFTAQDVKALREKTGVGMMECKKALVEADGDMDKAIDFLRERGLAAAQKKASRIAAEGVVLPYYDEATKQGVVVEVNSETDFVAKNEKFMSFVEGVAKTILATNPADVEALKEEIIVQETTNYSNYNYYSVGLLGVSSIFLMLTIIFSSILVKHQLKLKKKTSK